MDTAASSWYNYNNSKELTLSDFKPTKTRTEYKPVSMKDWEALKAFHEGQEFYHNTHLVTNTQTLLRSHQNNALYTKEEVELGWKDIVNEYDSDSDAFNDQIHEMCFLHQGTEKDFIRMCHEVADMTEKPQ